MPSQHCGLFVCRWAIWTCTFARTPANARTRATHAASASRASTTSTRTSASTPTSVRTRARSVPSRSCCRRSTRRTCATTPARNRTSATTAGGSSRRRRACRSTRTCTSRRARTSATSATCDSPCPTSCYFTLRWATPASRPTRVSSVTSRLTSGEPHVCTSGITEIWWCKCVCAPSKHGCCCLYASIRHALIPFKHVVFMYRHILIKLTFFLFFILCTVKSSVTMKCMLLSLSVFSGRNKFLSGLCLWAQRTDCIWLLKRCCSAMECKWGGGNAHLHFLGLEHVGG